MKQARFMILALLALLFVSVTADIEVDEKGFHEALDKNPQTFVKFYSPYCGYCQRMAPLWTELTTAFEGILPVLSVDITKHTSLSQSQGVHSVPTMKWYDGKVNVADYTGERTRGPILTWVLNRLQPLSLVFDSSEWNSYLSGTSTHPLRFMYIYKEDEAPKDFTGLQKQLVTKGAFAMVKVTNDKLKQFEVIHGNAIKTLPAVATASAGGIYPFNTKNLGQSLDELTKKVHADNEKLDTWGDSSSESNHSTFTLLFFILALGVIGVVAWKKLRIGQSSNTQKQV